MNFTEYIFLAISSLFVIVDPLAAVPAFLAMTPTDTHEQRIKMGRLTARIMGLLLAAVAMQFMLDAVRQLNPAWLPAPV